MVRILRENHAHLSEGVEMRLLMPKVFGRTREPFGGSPPSWWEAEAARPGPRLVMALVDDVGPATKILGNLQAEAEGGLGEADAYISVDDDQAYQKGTLDQLLVQHDRMPACVLCYSGIRLTRQLDGSITQRNSGAILSATHVPSLRPSLAAAVDFPEGFAGILYPRGALLGLAPLRDALLVPEAVPTFVLRGDDYVLGNALTAIGVTQLTVVHVPHAPGRTSGDLAYGKREDALHAVDGSDPATRYLPIMQWAASSPEVPTPLLRDALWRDPYEANDLRGVPAGWDRSALAESRPVAGWAILAGLIVLAAVLYVLLRVSRGGLGRLSPSRPLKRRAGLLAAVVAVLAPLAVGLAVLVAPRRKNAGPTRRREAAEGNGWTPSEAKGSGEPRSARRRRRPLCWLRPRPGAAAADSPLCWPSAEYADLIYEPGEYEFADADDPLGMDLPPGACDGYPNALSPAGPFLELADGRCAVVGPGGAVRIVAPAGRARAGGVPAILSSPSGRPRLPVVGSSRHRPPWLARDLGWRRGPPQGGRPYPAMIIAVPAQSAGPLLEALLSGGRQHAFAPAGSIVRLVGPGEIGSLAELAATWQEAAAEAGVTIELHDGVSPSAHPALLALSERDPEDALLVTVPDPAAAEHLSMMLARSVQMPRCVIAAEAGVLVNGQHSGPLMLQPCPAGCAASVMDSDHGPVVYRAGMLRAAAAAASRKMPATDMDLADAFAAAGVPILRLPDPYVGAIRSGSVRAFRAGLRPIAEKRIPPGLRSRALRAMPAFM